MEEKSDHILACGVRLFARHGYHKTSIDDIAKEAGISKGAFYLYFSSKESFLVAAFTMFQSQMIKQIEHIQQLHMPPKQSFSEQITRTIKHLYAYKNFLLMYFQEDISIGEETRIFIKEMKQSNIAWIKSQIHAVYGEEVESIKSDVAIMFEGIYHSYVRWAIIEQVNVPLEDIGPFIIDRLDDLVAAMLAKGSKPLLSNGLKMNHRITDGNEELSLQQLLQEIQTILIPTSANQTEIQHVIQVLESECAKDHPQLAIIRGLLTQLRTFSIYEYTCEKIARVLGIQEITS